uniref:G-protein coupled receptors family 1 profile domain-containing protein n=2 Tax=Denticeps clupeoides TaxID=299321 RepID=A0AAY4CXF6_9TELE
TRGSTANMNPTSNWTNSSSPGDECPSSADFQFQLFPVVYCLVMTLGLPGNLATLWALVLKKARRSPSDVYIINLAVADAAFLCTLPFRVHYHLHHNVWAFGGVACSVTGAGFYANIYVSISFMTCICVDRYMATVHPLTYLRLRNSRCAVLVSAAVWLVFATAMAAFVLLGPLDTPQDSCFEGFSDEEWERRVGAYSAMALLPGSLLPTGIILVCYPLAARRIARIGTGAARRALRLIYAVLAITLLCFLPHHAVLLLHLLRRTHVLRRCDWADGVYKARRATTALLSLNSCLDPALYYFSRPGWRRPGLGRLLRPPRTRGVYVIAADPPTRPAPPPSCHRKLPEGN